MTRPLRAALVAAALALASPARAHHGGAAVGAAALEGPGAAIDTTSPLPLPAGAWFVMTRTELVEFRRYAFAEPDNRSYASFNTLALGRGILPWLSFFAFQPFNVKAQDGAGRNVGAGDTNLMLSLAFKRDGGFQLVPERESLDDLMDWHFGVSVASTVPVGPTTARGREGASFAPDMQTGFGAPSPTAAVSVMKQVATDLTWLADASYQHFFPHRYPSGRYQFGDETRLDTAGVYRIHASGRLRIDLSGELSALHLERDRAQDDAGALAARRASGGDVLYAGAGVRASYGRFSAALGVKRAALARLNEEAQQQGSEGLERFRATLALSCSIR